MFIGKSIKLSVLFSFFFCTTIFAKTPQDSAKKVLSNIDRAYNNSRITKKEYLDSVYFSNKEALTILTNYRKAIWEADKNLNGDEKYNHKRKYYGILANQAQMASRMGENLYYAEKIERLEQEVYRRPSLTALSIIAGYYQIHRSPKKIIALYEKVKNYVGRVPELGRKDSLDAINLVQAAILLEHVAEAYYELNSVSEGLDAEAIIKNVINVVEDKYPENENVNSYTVYLKNLAAIKRAAATKNSLLEKEYIDKLQMQLNNTCTPEYLKSYINNDLIGIKIDFFFRNYQPDSLTHYLNINQQLVIDEGQPYNVFLHVQARAKELYMKGLFKTSADSLNKAITLLDSSRSIVVQDVDDMLYAHAEAEEKELLLKDASIKQRKAEQYFLIASTTFGILLLSGIFMIRYVRHRQHSRFIQFKYNLARNIHDETSPALLYAKALIKKNGQNKPKENNELEKHIDHIMALLRSLSHDLRLNEQYTIGILIDNVADLLRKLNTDQSFTYSINKLADSRRFISHYQYTELRAILNECVTNTFKHANFTKIDITFKLTNNQLAIVYKDNGMGWEAGSEGNGIGLNNIKERVKGMNGKFNVVNNYPNGYSLEFMVFLR